MSDLAKMAAIAKHFVTNGDDSVHLHSENGTAYELSVDNSGALTVTNEETGAVSGVGGGSGLPTGGAAHQQLVTDADGNATWEDRTHYAYTKETVILKPSDLTRTEDDVFIVTEPLATPLVEGMEYTVEYNEAEYKCPAKATSIDGVDFLVLGNYAAFGGEDTGEPFVFAPYPADMATNGEYAQLTPFDGAESVTLSITFIDETVKTIDPKFLPAGSSVIYVADLTVDGETLTACYADREMTTQLDYASGKEMLLNGAWLCIPDDEMGDSYNAPLILTPYDAQVAVLTIVYSMRTGAPGQVALGFSDTPTTTE